MSTEMVLGLYNYWIVIFLMMTGFYIVIARSNMVKTVIGLNIFQTSVFLLYITMGKVRGGKAPILSAEESREMSHAHDHEHDHEAVEHANDHASNAGDVIHQVGFAPEEAAEATEKAAEVFYTNPLPSVLMLTAIVVGIATTALALALIVRVREDYGTIEEDEILEIDRQS